MAIDYVIRFFDSLGSTQSLAKLWADAGKEHGTVIHTLRQKKGYGRHGSKWVSEEGNLYLSVILRPEKLAKDWGQISLIAGLAAVRAIYDERVRIKWPNDILLLGKKCGGIIIEAEASKGWLVLGYGLNIATAPDLDDVDYEAISLGSEDILFDVEKAKSDFLEHFSRLYEEWENDGFDGMVAKWLSHAFGVGSEISVRLANSDIKKGIFKGLDNDGHLMLGNIEDDNDILIINSGDILY